MNFLKDYDGSWNRPLIINLAVQLSLTLSVVGFQIWVAAK